MIEEKLTNEEIKYLNNKLLKISISGVLEVNGETIVLNADIFKQFEFFKDCNELNDSELTFKYFKNAFPDQDFDSNGNFMTHMYRSSVFQLLFKDLGVLSISDIVNEGTFLYPNNSKTSTEILKKFKRFPNIVSTLFEYYHIEFEDKFKHNKNEAFLDVPNIKLL